MERREGYSSLHYDKERRTIFTARGKDFLVQSVNRDEADDALVAWIADMTRPAYIRERIQCDGYVLIWYHSVPLDQAYKDTTGQLSGHKYAVPND